MYNPQDLFDVNSADAFHSASHFQIIKKLEKGEWLLNVNVRRFHDKEDAHSFLTKLNKVHDPRVALVYPVFTIPTIPDCYFVYTKRPSKTLNSFVGNATDVQNLHSGAAVKVMYSGIYKRFIRDVLEVSITLWACQLSCILGLDSMEIVSDPVAQLEHFCLRFIEVEDRLQDEEEEIAKIVNFIELLNEKAKLKAEHVLSYEELENLLRELKGCKGILNENIFNIPFFWHPRKRGDFICDLILYLDSHKNDAFTTPDIEKCYKPDWVAKFRGDKILGLLKEQDGLDRAQYNVKARPSSNVRNLSEGQKKEIELRNWLDFMRQVWTHYLRMNTTLIGSSKMTARIDLVDVDLLFSKAYPNYLQYLVNETKRQKLKFSGGVYY